MASDVAYVYNRESVGARNILTNVLSNDIGQDTIRCVLAVDVDAAHFVEQRMQNGFHRPYMEILGSVSEVFMEDDNDDVFPCGTKRLKLDEPQPVRVAYIPSSQELRDLVDMGLYYSDFDVPHNLVGNTIEIPSDITYTYVYDTIVGMVGINDPYNIETSTKENHYENIFQGCEVSEQRVQEESADYVYTLEEPVAGIAPYQSVLTDYLEDDLAQTEELSATQAVEETEDQKTISNFAKVLATADKEIGEKRAAVDATSEKTSRIVADIENEARKANAAAAKRANADKDIYAQLMGNSAADDAAAAENAKLKYDAFKAAMLKWQQKAAEVAKDGSQDDGTAKEDIEKSRQVDRARDNQALNDGIADISGFGADVSANESKMSAEEKAKHYAKKSQEAARRLDVALDNQALNRGETDIAGQGAGNNSDATEKARREKAADLMRSLLGGGKPSSPQTGSDSPNYL